MIGRDDQMVEQLDVECSGDCGYSSGAGNVAGTGAAIARRVVVNHDQRARPQLQCRGEEGEHPQCEPGRVDATDTAIGPTVVVAVEVERMPVLDPASMRTTPVSPG